MKTTKKDQVKSYAAWLWNGQKTELFTNGCGVWFIGIPTDLGECKKQLTQAYKTIPELLAYLQGLHAARY